MASTLSLGVAVGGVLLIAEPVAHFIVTAIFQLMGI